MGNVLVLGIGNILLRDEGVGVRVVEALQSADLPPGVDVADGGTAGADLVELIADRSKVIIVDAIQADAAPGTVLRMSADAPAPEEGDMISLHQLGLVESLLIARGSAAPREAVVFGVQPGAIEPGLELTREVAAAVPRVVRAILAEIECGADASALG